MISDGSLYDNSHSYENVDTGTEPVVEVQQETPEERAERLKQLNEELVKVITVTMCYKALLLCTIIHSSISQLVIDNFMSYSTC